MRLATINPKGMAPSLNPTVLADNMAQWALNGLHEPGRFRPLREPTFVAQPSKVGDVQSLFLYEGAWLNWISQVSVCRSPIADDMWRRLYFAGGDSFKPQYTTGDLAVSGNDWPGVTYDLGVPASTVAPGVLATGEITDDDPTLVETRYYVEVFVSAYGEEGAPGPVSAEVEVSPGQDVQLSGLAAVPGGNMNITHRRIYRTNTGTSGTEFQMVRPSAFPGGLIPVAVNSVLDDCASGSLGSVMVSSDYDLPPEDLHSMISLPSGAFAGLSGNQLCFSVPYQPHAWPVGYRRSFDYDAVSIGAYGNYILVTTKGDPYVVIGSHPESMTEPERAEEGYACVSSRGLVDMGYSIIYPSVDGLRIASMKEMRVLTDGLIDHETWKNMRPETIHAYLWDGKYVAFWDDNVTGTKGFVYDPASGTLDYHMIEAFAGFNDKETGDLYILTAAGICLWDSGAAMTAEWKGKRFVLQDPTGMACGRVLAEGYPLTFQFWSNGQLKRTRPINSSKPFKLPGGFLSDELEYQISGSHAWTMIAVATSEKELVYAES